MHCPLFLSSRYSRFSATAFAKFARLLAMAVFLTASAAFAQSPAAGSNWDHLKALPPGTKLHISADKGGHTCKLVSVDDATLVCGKHTFARPEVKTVKLTRYAASYLAGAGIGAGVGIGIGLGIAPPGHKDDFLDFSGDVRVVSTLTGAVIGTLVTGPADLFKGPTVYRRQ